MFDYLFPVLFFAFILGVTVGSFVNVVVYRSRSGVSLGGRSKCMSCAKPLKARMLVPLFSYLYQQGKCGFCGVKISLQYPIVEALLGMLYVVVLLVHDFNPITTTPAGAVSILLDGGIWTLLLAITVYDLKHKIIPDVFSGLLATLAGVALVFKWYLGVLPTTQIASFPLGVFPWWIDLAAGPILALPFAALWFFSGGRAMGLGDAKLTVGLGWFLGFTSGITAIVLAFWVAFVPSVFLLLVPNKRFTMKSEIPFAPFLVIGTFLTYLCGFNMLTWTL